MKLIRISKEEWVNLDNVEGVKVLDHEILIMTPNHGYFIERGSGYYELTLKSLKINK